MEFSSSSLQDSLCRKLAHLTPPWYQLRYMSFAYVTMTSICFVKKQNSSKGLLQNIAKKFVHRIICLLTNLCVVLLTGISPVTESHASLSTFNDQSVSFKVLKDGRYVINVEDSGKLQENGRQFETISSCLYLVMMTGKV